MDHFVEYVNMVAADAEKKLGRALKESERQGLLNCKSLMFLELVADSLYFCKTQVDLDKWAADIDGFDRGTEVKRFLKDHSESSEI